METPLVVEGQVARDLINRMARYASVPSTSRTVLAIMIDRPFVVVQDADDAPIRGMLTCNAGCYLVYTQSGALYPVPGEVFEVQYRAEDW